MAQIIFELDDDKKNELEEMINSMGMNLEAFFTVYIVKALREKRVPFDIVAHDDDEDFDPFYSEENMERLRRAKAQLDAGRGVEHELIEVD